MSASQFKSASEVVLAPGAILVRDGTGLPVSLHAGNGPHAAGWSNMADHLNGREIESRLSSAGWTFFYMAGTYTANVFGFDRPRMLQAALKRVLTSAARQTFNCVEIDTIAHRSFWGFPYVALSVHCRHIQQGVLFLAS